MLAQQGSVFQETCETVFRLNQDEKVRYWCEAREEADRIARTIEHDYEVSLAEKEAERDRAIAEKDNAIAEKDNTIAERNIVIAEKDRVIAEKDAQIAMLAAQLSQR